MADSEFISAGQASRLSQVGRGDPGGNRTPNPQFRRLMLYPVELRGHGGRMVRPERFELPTFWFVARRSIQLS